MSPRKAPPISFFGIFFGISYSISYSISYNISYNISYTYSSSCSYGASQNSGTSIYCLRWQYSWKGRGLGRPRTRGIGGSTAREDVSITPGRSAASIQRGWPRGGREGRVETPVYIEMEDILFYNGKH
jgi:hypothetical protein